MDKQLSLPWVTINVAYCSLITFMPTKQQQYSLGMWIYIDYKYRVYSKIFNSYRCLIFSSSTNMYYHTVFRDSL